MERRPAARQIAEPHRCHELGAVALLCADVTLAEKLPVGKRRVKGYRLRGELAGVYEPSGADPVEPQALEPAKSQPFRGRDIALAFGRAASSAPRGHPRRDDPGARRPNSGQWRTAPSRARRLPLRYGRSNLRSARRMQSSAPRDGEQTPRQGRRQVRARRARTPPRRLVNRYRARGHGFGRAPQGQAGAPTRPPERRRPRS